jgi:hypothetical protein
VFCVFQRVLGLLLSQTGDFFNCFKIILRLDNRFNRSRNVYGDCFYYGDEMKSNNKKNDDLFINNNNNNATLIHSTWCSQQYELEFTCSAANASITQHQSCFKTSPKVTTCLVVIRMKYANITNH